MLIGLFVIVPILKENRELPLQSRLVTQVCAAIWGCIGQDALLDVHKPDRTESPERSMSEDLQG
ncbi:hypothetical protein ASU31_02280 [Pedobacter ginsenosidimutans]|uniref:Uncharacterized protein n=1 Tax=Pedobacter ginsenosidimutans TaxID=687842 RepID=A0A0T5VW99_9SPHI|nr:hypothetical protein ASU31_02280 [Pedobacter ginsenosidimutans]